MRAPRDSAAAFPGTPSPAPRVPAWRTGAVPRAGTLPRAERALWLLLAAALIAATQAVTGAPRLANDGLQQIAAADQLLARGQAATTLVHFDVERASGRLPAPLTTFPPGLALAMAPFRALGAPGPWSGWLVAALSTLGLIPLTFVAAPLLGLTAGATRLVVLLLAANAQLLTCASFVVTEPLFTWLLLASILCALRYEVPPRFDRRLPWVLAAGLLAGLSYWVRYAGAFLAGTLAAFYFLRWVAVRSRPALLAFLGASTGLLGVAAGLVRNWAITGDVRGGNTKVVSRSVLEIAPTFLKTPLHLLFGEASFQTARWLLADLVVLAIAVAACHRAGRGQRRLAVQAPDPRRSAPATLLLAVLALYVTGITYLGFTSPISYESRMFVPLLPLVLLLAGRWFGRAWPERSAPSAVGSPARVAFALALAFYVGSNLAAACSGGGDALAPARRDLAAALPGGQPLTAWIDGQLPPGAPVLAVDGQATGYLLGRPAVSLLESEYSDQAWTEAHTRAVMRRFGIELLLVYPADRSPRTIVQRESAFLAALVEGRTPGWLVRAADSGRAAVFRVRPGRLD